MSIVGLKLWKYFPKSIGIQETTIQDNSEPEQDTQHTSTERTTHSKYTSTQKTAENCVCLSHTASSSCGGALQFCNWRCIHAQLPSHPPSANPSQASWNKSSWPLLDILYGGHESFFFFCHKSAFSESWRYSVRQKRETMLWVDIMHMEKRLIYRVSKNKVTSRKRKILTKIECCGVKFSHQNCLGVLVLVRNDKKIQAQRGPASSILLVPFFGTPWPCRCALHTECTWPSCW